ncbi:MAG: type II toxin-antitoxin system VapC family toxin [Chromatiaceae bacterium]
MRFLLDTQLILWWEMGHASLPAQARDLIDNNDQGVYISRASLWEMAIKLSLGRLRVDLERFVKETEQHGFQWLGITNQHLFAVVNLPVFEDHKDPFDRLLVAQSLTEPLILLTGDPKLAQYGTSVRVV